MQQPVTPPPPPLVSHHHPPPKIFIPLSLPDTSSLTPDHPQFHTFPTNLAILTKYGRGIYIRHGNQDRCSSFFATLGTIVNKMELSFGSVKEGKDQSAMLKCIKQGPLKVYLLRRLNYMYITWDQADNDQIVLYGMMELVHHQLMSCLTGKVNHILETNQTYDPSINFGKTKAQHRLLHYAFQTGLTSLPTIFNALPTMSLPASLKSSLLSLLRQQKIQGLQINILMTMQQVICIHKQKGIDLTANDIFLLNVLIQSQSSLTQSQIWYPICLPGVSFEDRVFCYINFVTDKIVHIMVSDQANIFAQLSQASKGLKEKLVGPLLQRINLSSTKQLISDPTLQKSPLLKHFLLRYTPSDESLLPQLHMSSGNYFGQNLPWMQQMIKCYGVLQHHYVRHRGGKKEKVHLQPLGDYMGGYCQEGNVSIFFVGGGLSQMDDCRAIGLALCKYVKEEENALWMLKMH